MSEGDERRRRTKEGKWGKRGRKLHTYVFFHFLFSLLSGRRAHKGGVDATPAEEKGEQQLDLGGNKWRYDEKAGVCTVSIAPPPPPSFSLNLPFSDWPRLLSG